MIDKLAIKNGKIYYRYVETYSELPTGFVTNINQIDVSKIGKTKVTIPSAIK